ncbi:hypothetical protein [Jeotgalibacillus campisalis]|uniref:Uncharacterized protein n=1 Tax=Jeotgalibacillus campisalis TaxID=220754 RepID=A0A0C2VGC4_9BACL|nr:hypothetical protein [Jeotgalibacillus campisalis]KIL43023.1 hypothetical protein KR50_34260 [Jeotgalibacillus campisalis]
MKKVYKPVLTVSFTAAILFAGIASVPAVNEELVEKFRVHVEKGEAPDSGKVIYPPDKRVS